VIYLFLFFWALSEYPNKKTIQKYIKEKISEYPAVISQIITNKRNKQYIIYFEDKPEYIFWIQTKVHGVIKGYDIWTNFHNIFTYYYLIEFNKIEKSTLIAKIADTSEIERNYSTIDIECHYSTIEDAKKIIKDTIEYWKYVIKQKYICRFSILLYNNNIKTFMLSFYLNLTKMNILDLTKLDDEYMEDWEKDRDVDEMNIEKELNKICKILIKKL